MTMIAEEHVLIAQVSFLQEVVEEEILVVRAPLNISVILKIYILFGESGPFGNHVFIVRICHGYHIYFKFLNE